MTVCVAIKHPSAMAWYCTAHTVHQYFHASPFTAGHLRPLGPRHSNDWEDFTRISIMPTPDELLCIVPPYLPPNK
jgi:hypothetical protein